MADHNMLHNGLWVRLRLLRRETDQPSTAERCVIGLNSRIVLSIQRTKKQGPKPCLISLEN
jgi:hypothetical protein